MNVLYSAFLVLVSI